MVSFPFFPAVFIGGPPHSGKSVLTYSLTHALRLRGIEHYVVRACPDGEGDWANQADQRLVRTIRVKGNFTPQFVEFIRRDVQNRHLPLLVDVGGKPRAWQEAIFDHCTHAILLVNDAAALAEWRALAARHSIPIVAEYLSVLDPEIPPSDESTFPYEPLQGVVNGLIRGQVASGPPVARLVDLLADLFAFPAGEIRQAHLSTAKAETVVELNRLLHSIDPSLATADNTWHPRHLVPALAYLPQKEPLALYDRAPNWLYAAIAAQVLPARMEQFDARLGWVDPPRLRFGVPPATSPLQATHHSHATHDRLEFTIPDHYLDISEVPGLPVPAPNAGTGLVLSGKIPHWLLTALAIHYAPHVPWLAVYQPHLDAAGDKAIVVWSPGGTPAVADLVSSPAGA